MALPSIYEKTTADEIINRIEKLTVETQPQWGKMNVGQMLAHVSVAYDLAYGKTEDKKSPVMRFFLRMLLKGFVTNDKSYRKNSRTAPVFLITDERDFNAERGKLISYVKETQQKGATFFEGKESASFGRLTATEWNNLFYKHMDHHLRQFGV